MKIVVYQYLPSEEWAVGLSWGNGGHYQERIRAKSFDEATEVCEQMKDILVPAIESCRQLAQKTQFGSGEWFGD